MFRDEAHASLFSDYINSRHTNISFAMEKEDNGSIFFLDTKIARDSRNNFSSDVYRKPTFSGLAIPFIVLHHSDSKLIAYILFYIEPVVYLPLI